MTTLKIDVPDAALLSLKLRPEGFAEELKLLAALKLFEIGWLSSGRAAELAGIPRIEFLSRIGVTALGPSST